MSVGLEETLCICNLDCMIYCDKVTHRLNDALVICSGSVGCRTEEVALNLILRLVGINLDRMNILNRCGLKNDINLCPSLAHSLCYRSSALDEALSGKIGGGAVHGSCAKEGTDADTRNGVVGNSVDLATEKGYVTVSGKLPIHLGKICAGGYGNTEDFLDKLLICNCHIISPLRK